MLLNITPKAPENQLMNLENYVTCESNFYKKQLIIIISLRDTMELLYLLKSLNTGFFRVNNILSLFFCTFT